MGTNNTPVVVSFSIVILLLLSLLLLLTYNSKCSAYLEPMENPPQQAAPGTASSPGPARKSVATNANQSVNLNDITSGIGQFGGSSANGDEAYAPLASQNKQKFSDANKLKEHFENAPYPSAMETPSMSAELSQSANTQSCFPRDRLTAQDLLPKDAADSKWAQLNPSGGGDIHDQNYLTAGYHIGVNTVGQSMRNANLQLRSEIPNPQTPVGPWMISTIEPDLRQNTLEIGSSPSY
jgi:hypothetical protein